MPWWKREVYLIILGAAALALSIIVLARDKSIDTEFLATIGVIGSLAIIVVSLPVKNGKGRDELCHSEIE